MYNTGPALPMGPATRPDTLAEYARTGYTGVRERVAAHANTPLSVLLELDHDTSPAVRTSARRAIARRQAVAKLEASWMTAIDYQMMA